MTQDLNSSGGVLAQLVPMRRYARALTRDESAAEDLVHDALVRAYERRDTFRTGGNLRTWLLSIVHNTFVDQKRRRQAERRYEAETAPLAESAAPASQESSVQLAEIQRAFLSLPAEQRAVLHLVGIEGLKYREAADILGIPVGTLMIHASIGPCRCICGSTSSRTLAKTFSSDQRPSPTKCSKD